MRDVADRKPVLWIMLCGRQKPVESSLLRLRSCQTRALCAKLKTEATSALSRCCWFWLKCERKSNHFAWPTTCPYVVPMLFNHFHNTIDVVRQDYRFNQSPRSIGLLLYSVSYPSTRAARNVNIFSHRSSRSPKTEANTIKNWFLAKCSHFTLLTHTHTHAATTEQIENNNRRKNNYLLWL